MNRSILLFSILLLLMGCAKAKPFKYHPDSEIPEGPGLFSGEKGAFVIYDDSKKNQAQPNSQDAASGKGQVESTDEFRQFQQWQKDKKQYQEFQEWKQSEKNAKEYQEFLEWKRWKAFKEWQKKQQTND